MPWRDTKDPYQILLSEIMLQQTQISRVLIKYEEFLKAFPTIEALAKASDKKLLKVWQGMGYWRRAKYLKETAKIITKEYNGRFPKNPEELERLPGIGHYTARAVSCFAFNNSSPFIDTNIRRVYLHFFFKDKEGVPDSEILKLAEKAISTLPKEITPREWGYALFDYGAIELKDKNINKRSRHYTKQSKFEGSFRSYRTKVVNHLLSQRGTKDRRTTVEELLADGPYSSDKVIDSLLNDDIIKKKGEFFTL